MARKSYTAEEALAIILGESAEDIDDSEYCHGSDFEDEIDTEDEVAAATLVDLAVPRDLQPRPSGGNHNPCADGAGDLVQNGNSHSDREGTQEMVSQKKQVLFLILLCQHSHSIMSIVILFSVFTVILF